MSVCLLPSFILQEFFEIGALVNVVVYVVVRLCCPIPYGLDHFAQRAWFREQIVSQVHEAPRAISEMKPWWFGRPLFGVTAC